MGSLHLLAAAQQAMHQTPDFQDIERLHQKGRPGGLEKLPLLSVQHIAGQKDEAPAERVWETIKSSDRFNARHWNEELGS